MDVPHRTIAIADPAERSLPPIDDLPEPFRRLALHQLAHPGTTSDHLLIMADGLAEAAEAVAMADMPAKPAANRSGFGEPGGDLRDRTGAALRRLAGELRGLAPAYRTGSAP